MSAKADPEAIRWRLHLASPAAAVYLFLASDEGRACFWAESAVEEAGHVLFRFPGGQQWRGRILAAEPPHRYSLVYYGGSTVTFTLADDGAGGTDLSLVDEGVPAEYREVVLAGWVSVLLALKAAADFGVNLRNHDLARTWEQGYADN